MMRSSRVVGDRSVIRGWTAVPRGSESRQNRIPPPRVLPPFWGGFWEGCFLAPSPVSEDYVVGPTTRHPSPVQWRCVGDVDVRVSLTRGCHVPRYRSSTLLCLLP